MLREHRENGTELGKEAKSYMNNGDLVPDDLVIKMIMEEIETKGDDGFLLDGFPRSVGQADALGEEIERRGRQLTAALLVDADDETVIRASPAAASAPTATSTTSSSTRPSTRTPATSAASRSPSATTTSPRRSRSASRPTTRRPSR